ncbi:hypothetical protein C1646_750308 [Rhizophagus diaphanus]|nr:hypothetical protein C1646_750308 [Rhizophagus diaphanus] [Rhizophagus sp. MUCL 43196]
MTQSELSEFLNTLCLFHPEVEKDKMESQIPFLTLYAFPLSSFRFFVLCGSSYESFSGKFPFLAVLLAFHRNVNFPFLEVLLAKGFPFLAVFLTRASVVSVSCSSPCEEFQFLVAFHRNVSIHHAKAGFRFLAIPLEAVLHRSLSNGVIAVRLTAPAIVPARRYFRSVGDIITSPSILSLVLSPGL